MVAMPASPSATAWCSRTNRPLPPVRQAGQQPRLPQRTAVVERALQQVLDHGEHRGLVPGSRHVQYADVVVDVEVGRVGPQWPTLAGPGRDEHLAQPGDQVQPALPPRPGRPPG